MKDLRRLAGSEPRFPRVVFVIMGDTEAGHSFLQPLWPDAKGVADPDKLLYASFGVERGGMAEMFGPRAVACGIRATVKGNFIGRKHGDPWTLPTFVLAEGIRVLWRHDGEHAGDHPRWSEVLDRVSA